MILAMPTERPRSGDVPDSEGEFVFRARHEPTVGRLRDDQVHGRGCSGTPPCCKPVLLVLSNGPLCLALAEVVRPGRRRMRARCDFALKSGDAFVLTAVGGAARGGVISCGRGGGVRRTERIYGHGLNSNTISSAASM